MLLPKPSNPSHSPQPRGLHVRLTATPRQRFCAALLGIAALGVQADPAWRTEVDAAIAAACAVRGLAAHEPLNVRPMADFQGGYTAGVGNVEWEDDHAEQWRSGWCALGVYCAKKRPAGNAASKNPMQGPAGLFDVEQNVLYVRGVASPDALDTVAHETTHALQFQNFPQLRSAHLWYNRDLAAAANAAIEGDAHIVGWFFNQAERLYTCSMAPGHGTSNRVRRRGWRPHSLWAHEGFPHVFGPELALERWLAGGTRIDDWLREPPLATLGVLRPERIPEVDFIRLADDLLAAKLTDGDCAAGLANTAGALGIWGLLAQHGNADAEQSPSFIEHWRGDRFRHIACAGKADDELAWVSRWRSAEAAHEFATRYRAIAASVLAHGAVLSAAPTPFVYDTTVVVATPGLHEAAPRLAAAPVRTFSRFGDWVAGGCFPQVECHAGNAVKPAATSEHLCAPAAEHPARSATRPARFHEWLARVRNARTTAAVPPAELDAALAAAGQLAKFCAVNRADNADWAQACRATYYGIDYMAQLLNDVNWQRLPYCTTETGMRNWYRETYYADAERPFSDGELFRNVFGPALAGRALAERGVLALSALAAKPPLSTLAILKPGRAAVDFMRLPRAELAAHGCEIASSSVRGVLSAWQQFVDDGALAEKRSPPPFLFDWRGDRQAYLRCAEHEGWLWASRWASEESAHAFAALAARPPALAEVVPAADVHTVWIAAPELAAAKAVLQAGLEVRTYSTLAAWRADGCFPQAACN